MSCRAFRRRTRCGPACAPGAVPRRAGRRQHRSSVVVWPAAQGRTAGPRATTRQGYHLLHWATPAYAYWVASVLGLAELGDFVALLQRGDSAAAAAFR